jgi:hypothetical protein
LKSFKSENQSDFNRFDSTVQVRTGCSPMASAENWYYNQFITAQHRISFELKKLIQAPAAAISLVRIGHCLRQQKLLAKDTD